ncbi:MAG: NAD(+)/NADH kinase [Phycisphaerales bacterium]|nr:NAD(+)/NADH kinase [Phycisphaerales bacterium]
MPDASSSTRTSSTVLLLADRSRPEAVEACGLIEQSLGTLDIPFVTGTTDESEAIPDSPVPDVAIVIGGDGTMIAQTRRLVDLGIPMIGVNCGRLGFLAPFSPDTFHRHLETVLRPDRALEHRMMLAISVEPADGSEAITRRAMNDAVITAGEPYRMIRMTTTIDGQDGPRLSGDGLVIATPTGSTGHNASAGGPIVDPRVEAIVVCPIAAQSLAFRPCVLDGDSCLEVVLTQVNEGTALVLDGQRRLPLQPNDRIRFSRYATPMKFVVCPGGPFWRILHDKLGWAAPPRERGGDRS